MAIPYCQVKMALGNGKRFDERHESIRLGRGEEGEGRVPAL
jgi:hypothetical protein